MLKNKRSVSACSLSSCRIRAEALARAFNNRIWNPCVWIPVQRSSAEGDDGMPNGLDDEEEFFDASPSPVEAEDESMFCQQHSSAATDAGRAKLYELLQQHATDDAIDVFYDVGEENGPADANESCLVSDGQESDEIKNNIGPSASSNNIENENNFSKTLDLHESGGLRCISVKQIFNSPADCEPPNSQELEIKSDELDNKLMHVSACEISDSPADSVAQDSQEIKIKSDELNKDTVIDSFTTNKSSDETRYNLQNGDQKNIEETKDEKSEQTTETKSININDKPLGDGRFRVKKSLVDENGIPIENGENISGTTLQSTDSPVKDTETAEVVIEENDLSTVQMHLDGELHSINTDISVSAEENNIAIKVIAEADPPTGPSEASHTASSPTSRLQVFDELRPKISRSTSLKTGKTPPGTPSRKKIVRFADVLGLDLEDVRHIILGDLPNIPSSAYMDLNLKDLDLPRCEPISETIEINRRDSASWKLMTGTTATNVIYPMFPIPGEQTDFMDRVRQQGICLEKITVSEMSIQCTCRVMNYGYHKKVIARYTVNDWQTSNDIDATYVPGSSHSGTDGFSFNIFLSPNNRNVKFALKYMVNNQQYWDNNKNQNYCLGFHGNYHLQQLPSISWQDQFW